jgi:hypothetical protein
MFAINHAATALLLKRRFPDVSLLTLLLSVQAMEFAWVVLNYVGVERTGTDTVVRYGTDRQTGRLEDERPRSRRAGEQHQSVAPVDAARDARARVAAHSVNSRCSLPVCSYGCSSDAGPRTREEWTGFPPKRTNRPPLRPVRIP